MAEAPRISLTILLVDDEPALLRAIARVLKRTGAEVIVAESAEHGLQLLEEHKPGLVISDYRLPQMDGLAFLERVAVKVPGARRVLHSGTCPDRSKGLGITFLQKPCPNETFVSLVASMGGAESVASPHSAEAALTTAAVDKTEKA